MVDSFLTHSKDSTRSHQFFDRINFGASRLKRPSAAQRSQGPQGADVAGPHPSPVPTVDAIIELAGGRVVLVRRKYAPLGWALPGGFVEVGETLEEAVARESLEETGLHIQLVEQLFTYSDPRRDARRHTLSTVFLARAEGEPLGGDDAAEARAFELGSLPSPIVFDHPTILADYRRYKATGQRRVLWP